MRHDVTRSDFHYLPPYYSLVVPHLKVPNSIFTTDGWVLDSNITTPTRQNKIHCYLEEVDTLDDVDMDEDVDTELEVETLKKKNRLPLYSKRKREFFF